MNKLDEQTVGITESGLNKKQKPFCTPAFPAQNNERPSLNKPKYLKINTQTHESSLTLPVDLTKIDADIAPFWNKQSTVLHATLWQPHRTESREADSPLLNGLLNYQVDESKFWKKTITQNNSIPSPLSHLLPALSIHTTGNEAQHAVKTTKKIRVYPENEKRWFDVLNQSRRAYNLTTAAFQLQQDIKDGDLRSQIRQITRSEAEEAGNKFVSVVSDDAFRDTQRARSAVIKKRKRKQKAKLNFRSKLAKEQSFVCQKLSAGGVFPSILGKCHWSEPMPKDAIGHAATVLYSHGRWFVCCLVVTETAAPVTENMKIVAVDPGVRTFITSFSENESVKYGDEFAEANLLPLMLAKDRLLSLRDALKKEPVFFQWVGDAFRYIERQLNRIENKKQDLVKDLHQRIAYDLVQNYDIILLPKFETKKMTKKSNETHKRFLRRKTVRSMLSLSHFKFKMVLKWMATKYGKCVIDANESYTSKTRWDGSVDHALKGEKSISFQGKTVDRDVHGARNILIRFLTKVIDVLSPGELTPETELQPRCCGCCVFQ